MSHYDFILLLTIFVLTERQKQVPPYGSLFLPLNKKIKKVIATFLSDNSDFFIVIASLHKYGYIYIYKYSLQRYKDFFPRIAKYKLIFASHKVR